MTDDNQRGRRSSLVRNLPADLTAILVVTMVAVAAIVVPVVNMTSLRTLFTVPLVLFVPGYALVAVLFPHGSKPESDETVNDDTSGHTDHGGITWVERVVLSFVTSIAVVPVIGLILSVTPLGTQLEPVVLAASGVTLALTYSAANRRAQLPENDRLVVSYQTWIQSVRSIFLSHTSRPDTVLSVVALLSLVLIVTSVGYAFVVPQQAGAFTELYLVTEQENGDLIAAEYPTEFSVGESQPLVVSVGNNEHREIEYSLVVELQEATAENDSVTVHRGDELYREQSTVSDGETWHEEVDITPSMAGERLRLSFMLFKGDVPSDPAADDAYRETNLWISVSADS